MTFNRAALFVSSLIRFLISRILTHVVYLFLGFLVSWFITNDLIYSDLRPIIGSLQIISPAVFTLAGIWIAYSYPEAISAFTSPSTIKLMPTDGTKRIENLVLIVLTSAFVISSLLVFDLLYMIIPRFAFYSESHFWWKLFGVAFVLYLCILQLRAIFTVMITNVEFVNELHKKKTEKSANDDL